jgi:hypothetical protein
MKYLLILAAFLGGITIESCNECDHCPGAEITMDLAAPIGAPEHYPTNRIELPIERPTVNLPLSLRQKNWNQGKQGSCVHATLISLLRWQNEFALADYHKSRHGGGEWIESMNRTLDRDGIRYAYTATGDVSFLEWACETRRGAGVAIMGGKHMVALVHLDKEQAALLDNRRVHRYIWVPRSNFVSEWLHSGGWAVTPVYSPVPPLPDVK